MSSLESADQGDDVSLMIHRGAVRAIILAMAGLVFVGVSGPVPPERAGAASLPGEFLVYYGWPSHINGSAVSAAAAAEFGRYDFVALGAGAEDPGHPDHEKTAAILADPAMAGTYVFGYVNLGVANGSLSLDEVRARIDGWRAIGADAILFDAFGYDFGVTRERQNAAVGHAHDLGMSVLANAWFPADAFGAAVDPVANPEGLPSLLGAADFYMSESYRVMLGQLVPDDQWRTKAGELAGYQSQLGFSILSVTTNSPANVYAEELFFAAWNAAAADGHLATGWGEYLFSAVDGQAPYRARPGAVDLPDDGGGGAVDPPDGGGGDVDRPTANTDPPPVLCAGVEATIVGTPGDDRLLGTEGRDVIAGLGGRDVIYAGGGDDLVCGGDDDDVISGGSGNDRLLGGPGSDELSGDPGDDVVLGGGGHDRLAGGAGSDVLRGQGGNDRLEGGEGDDRLIGGAGTDELLGDGGDDRLFGQGGDDLLQGGAGVDRARGGPQTDSCEAERTFACEA